MRQVDSLENDSLGQVDRAGGADPDPAQRGNRDAPRFTRFFNAADDPAQHAVYLFLGLRLAFGFANELEVRGNDTDLDVRAAEIDPGKGFGGHSGFL